MFSGCFIKDDKPEINDVYSVQSSLSIFAQKYLHKREDTYFILQNNFIPIYKNSLEQRYLEMIAPIMQAGCYICKGALTLTLN